MRSTSSAGAAGSNSRWTPLSPGLKLSGVLVLGHETVVRGGQVVGRGRRGVGGSAGTGAQAGPAPEPQSGRRFRSGGWRDGALASVREWQLGSHVTGAEGADGGGLGDGGQAVRAVLHRSGLV